jgi:hypothetical protein
MGNVSVPDFKEHVIVIIAHKSYWSRCLDKVKTPLLAKQTNLLHSISGVAKHCALWYHRKIPCIVWLGRFLTIEYSGVSLSTWIYFYDSLIKPMIFIELLSWRHALQEDEPFHLNWPWFLKRVYWIYGKHVYKIQELRTKSGMSLKRQLCQFSDSRSVAGVTSLLCVHCGNTEMFISRSITHKSCIHHCVRVFYKYNL